MTPTNELTAEVDSARPGGRRRTGAVAMIASAASVVATIGGAAVVFSPDRSGTGPPPAAPAESVAPPPGFEFVGFGHAAIAVPKGWARNALECEAPRKDTVIIDLGGVRDCGVARPAGVESVSLWTGTPTEAARATAVEIEGVVGERTATDCRRDNFGVATICTSSVHFPSLGLTFTADSSTSAAEVDRVLARIRMVPDRVGIPGHWTGRGGRVPQAAFVEALERDGLVARIETKLVRLAEAGTVLATSPPAGELVRPGDVVTVTVAAEPSGPADEVIVGIRAQDPKGNYGNGLSDEQVRDGGTLEVGVGDLIWAYGKGKNSREIAGSADGASLTAYKRGPNLGRSWKATSPGRSEVTLTVPDEGENAVLGVVTVVVR